MLKQFTFEVIRRYCTRFTNGGQYNFFKNHYEKLCIAGGPDSIFYGNGQHITRMSIHHFVYTEKGMQRLRKGYDSFVGIDQRGTHPVIKNFCPEFIQKLFFKYN